MEKEEFLVKEKSINYGDGKKLYKKIQSLEKAMHQAAKKLDFEKATELRDELQIKNNRFNFLKILKKCLVE